MAMLSISLLEMNKLLSAAGLFMDALNTYSKTGKVQNGSELFMSNSARRNTGGRGKEEGVVMVETHKKKRYFCKKKAVNEKDK